VYADVHNTCSTYTPAHAWCWQHLWVHTTLSAKNVYALVHARLCNGAETSLPWKLLRTYLESCASIVQAVVCRPLLPPLLLSRPNPSPDAVRSRNPYKFTQLMTRSPLRCRTSITRSSALVQASSSLSMGRTRAWPRGSLHPEFYFRHFPARVYHNGGPGLLPRLGEVRHHSRSDRPGTVTLVVVIMWLTAAGVGCSSLTSYFSWTVTLVILGLGVLRARLLGLCCTDAFPSIFLQLRKGPLWSCVELLESGALCCVDQCGTVEPRLPRSANCSGVCWEEGMGVWGVLVSQEVGKMKS